MRLRTALFAAILATLTPAFAAVAQEAEKEPPVKGMYLLTDYPAVTVRPGTTSTINLRLQNFQVPPERFSLAVEGVPQGWTATLLGGGQPIAAAMATTNQSTTLQLRIDVPEDAALEKSHELTVNASGLQTKIALPIQVSLAKELPARLSLTPQLPSLRGTARSSFEYMLQLRNDAGRDLVVGLSAQAPQNFGTTFTEQYGSQELNSIPVPAGETKTVKLTVRPPSTARADTFPVTVRASAEDAVSEAKVELEISGQPRLTIAGRDGIVSGRAEAGRETSIPIVVTNTGTSPAEEVELSSSAPSGWRIVFEPKAIDRIPPGENREVQALITPPEKAIAGDYAPTLNVSAGGESANAQFRIAVATSTMWGIVGAGIIGIALLIMIGAVARFGRR